MKTAHWSIGRGRYVGHLIYRSVLNGLDPFAELGTYDAVTQADVCLPALGINFWPNLDFTILQAIRQAHPTCLFVLNRRDPEAICDSIFRWRDLHRRLVVCDIPGLPSGFGRKRTHLRRWIENHYRACRATFQNDEQFLELDIEKDDVAQLLSDALGRPIRGWGNFKPSETYSNMIEAEQRG